MVAELPCAFIDGTPSRHLASSVTGTRSPFSFSTQTQDFGGECWTYSLTLKARGRALDLFINTTINKRLPFAFRDPTIRSQNMNTLVVAGANQTGNSLVVTGAWGATSLRAGDYFSVVEGGYARLHQLTEDVTPNGSGAATLRFVPRLRQSPVAGASVEVAAPAVTLMSLDTVSSDLLLLQSGRRHVGVSVTISAVEAL